jgi:hypothetical protein
MARAVLVAAIHGFCLGKLDQEQMAGFGSKYGRHEK